MALGCSYPPIAVCGLINRSAAGTVKAQLLEISVVRNLINMKVKFELRNFDVHNATQCDLFVDFPKHYFLDAKKFTKHLFLMSF